MPESIDIGNGTAVCFRPSAFLTEITSSLFGLRQALSTSKYTKNPKRCNSFFLFMKNRIFFQMPDVNFDYYFRYMNAISKS